MNSARGFSRVLSGFLCLLLVMSCTLFAVSASNAATEGYDIVFVIDDTPSMQDTDPERLAPLAVKKFIDNFPSTADCRYGIATYSWNICQDRKLGHTAEQIKDFVDDEKMITQNQPATDTAAGVEWAVEQLVTNGDSKRKPAIILIGDGENDTRDDQRTAKASDDMLKEAIKKANDRGIPVYAIAINLMPEQGENFRAYFNNIATSTGGTYHEPKNADNVAEEMDLIYESLTGTSTGNRRKGTLNSGEPFTETFEVPGGVFEMNMRCDHEKEIDIEFISPSGDLYTDDRHDVIFTQDTKYSNFKIRDPEPGPWTATYYSDVEQDFERLFIFHADVTIQLSKTEDDEDIVQNTPVRYVATVSAKEGQITDDQTLKDYQPKLVIVRVDEKGKEISTKSVDMKAEKGRLVVDYALEDAGKHQLYAEISGDKNKLMSNTISVDAKRDPNAKEPFPTWLIIVIAAAVVLLITLIIFLMNHMSSKPGSGYVKGSVLLKIVGRRASDETMIFQQNRFSCEQVFEKKNSLTDLISAYTRWYRTINSSELEEITLNQYINADLTEVTDKISICGNKKKKTIIKIPAGYEMQVDGMEISKPKTIIFNAPEKSIDLRFSNQGCLYTINMLFTKE